MDVVYLVCGLEGESINHVMFTCTTASHAWALFNFPFPFFVIVNSNRDKTKLPLVPLDNMEKQKKVYVCALPFHGLRRRSHLKQEMTTKSRKNDGGVLSEDALTTT